MGIRITVLNKITGLPPLLGYTRFHSVSLSEGKYPSPINQKSGLHLG